MTGISRLAAEKPPKGKSMAIDIKTLNHNQLDELIQKAETRKHELAKEKLVKLREKLTALAKAEGFTIEDLFSLKGAKRGAKRAPAKPKYRNPADHTQTWSGRGKRPRWFHAALTAGKKEKDLLI
jgi:DNA-binding protein H-NS